MHALLGSLVEVIFDCVCVCVCMVYPCVYVPICIYQHARVCVCVHLDARGEHYSSVVGLLVVLRQGLSLNQEFSGSG